MLTILAVADLERACDFYVKVFGWPVRVKVAVYVEFEHPAGGGLGLYVREGFARHTGSMPIGPQGPQTTATELYFRCDDLEAVIARLEDAGARLLSARGPRDWGDEAAYFQDPDGNVIAVARPDIYRG